MLDPSPQPTAPPPLFTRFALKTPAPIIRGQFPEAPPAPMPPPPPPGPATSTPFTPIPSTNPGPAPSPFTPASPPAGSPFTPAQGPGGEEAFNCGVANTPATGATGTTFGQGKYLGGFWDKCKQCFADIHSTIGGWVPMGPSGGLFKSDDRFDVFISPVSNPFYLEDPRALTEVRPIFLWQRTSRGGSIYDGGDIFFVGTQARAAITPWFSLVVNKLGFLWNEVEHPNAEFQNHVGFTEFHIGPKFSFAISETSGTILAGGLTFEIPTGPRKIFQNTGNLGLFPYLSFGQNFFRTSYGSFNFINTTGYHFGVDSERTDFLMSSFHLDFDVGNLKKIYPLVELSWFQYTQSGAVRATGFEGQDLFNFGANNIAGHSELILALGGRYRVNQNLFFGLTGEFSLLGGSSHLDRFRLTFDTIIRY